MKPTVQGVTTTHRTEVVIHFELPKVDGGLSVDVLDDFFDAVVEAAEAKAKEMGAEDLGVDLFLGNPCCSPYLTVTYKSDTSLWTLPFFLKELIMNTEIPETESEGGDHD